jgi:FkbM family methyltransferase
MTKTCEILARRAIGATGIVLVNINGLRLEVRPSDSDLFVLSQIFGWQEYNIDPEHLRMLRETASDWRASGITPLIIDAGANVGYSSLYLADMFPDAYVLAIEPNVESFKILTRHIESRATIKSVYAALWSHDRGLELKSSDLGSWGSQVVEGAGTPSKRLDGLINTFPHSRPFIIKMDIEGAEREVTESSTEIFATAKCIIVEPHDFLHPGAACLAPLFKIAATKRFDTILSGENIFLFALD